MLPRIRLWFERPLSGRGGALALGIRTGADGGVSCWPPPEKTGVPGRSSFPPGTPTSSSTVWFTSCWEALPSCHDKLLHAADMDPAPRTGVTWPGEAPPPPSGSLWAPAIWVPAGPRHLGPCGLPHAPPAHGLPHLLQRAGSFWPREGLSRTVQPFAACLAWLQLTLLSRRPGSRTAFLRTRSLISSLAQALITHLWSSLQPH